MYGPGKAQGGAGLSHRANAASELAARRQGSPQARCHPSADCPIAGEQQRRNGGHPSNPYPCTTQLSLSQYVSCTSQATETPSEPSVSICEQVSLCVGPSKGHLSFQVPSIPSRWPESPLVLKVKFCGNSFSQDWNPGLGSPCVGPGPIVPSWGLCSHTLPLTAQLTLVGAVPVCFTSLPSYWSQCDFSTYPQIYVL